MAFINTGRSLLIVRSRRIRNKTVAIRRKIMDFIRYLIPYPHLAFVVSRYNHWGDHRHQSI